MANEMFSSLPDVITAEQLASALQISKSGAYALLNHSDFPTLRVGGRKMVMKKDLLEWLNSHTNRPK
ncbi:MAG: helix-turn-helix domain-containing protein [Oscillospiraceae bacterium]|nr:helix-turn-helix domain-containing protein [Oscillospiraceae bacterium]